MNLWKKLKQWIRNCEHQRMIDVDLSHINILDHQKGIVQRNCPKCGNLVKIPFRIRFMNTRPILQTDQDLAWSLSHTKPGTPVSVRPVTPVYGGKTYLGLYLGEIPALTGITLEDTTNTIFIHNGGNPAIYVPILRKIIMGYESWWGVIDDPAHPRQITEQDLEAWGATLRSLLKVAEEKPKETPKDEAV
jgi:hypothetical protein